MISANKKIIIILASELPAGQLQLLQQMPELGMIAGVEVVRLSAAPAADSRPADWQRLGEEIYRRYSQADGYVVIQGLDNLLYAASAQSFLLGNLAKPVIFTGQLDDDPKNTQEFRANLINACQAATFDFGEVALMFGNRLLRANQARLADGLEAPESGMLGRIDFSIRLFEKNIRKNKGSIKFRGPLTGRLAIKGLSPLSVPADLWPDAGADALLVKADSVYNLPAPIAAELAKDCRQAAGGCLVGKPEIVR